MSSNPLIDDPLQPARLGVGIISAGRVGTVLGAALAQAGHQITGVHAVSEQSRDRADLLLPGAEILEIPEILRRSELVVLAVPDDALPTVVQGAVEAGYIQPGQLLVHTSGAHGAQVLAPAAAVGALTLAIHPAMTFTGMRSDIDRLSSARFAITADEDLLPIAQALTVEMGGEPVVVAESMRPRYHAALAHAANHLNTLVSQSVQLLASTGVPDPSRMLTPLMQAALDNALALGASALTGPVVRGDASTVAAHLQALADYDVEGNQEGTDADAFEVDETAPIDAESGGVEFRDMERADDAGSTTATYRALSAATLDQVTHRGALSAMQISRLRAVIHRH